MTQVVVDTSAVVAVVLGEPDAEQFAAALVRHRGDLLLIAATRVELGIVVEARHGPDGTRELEALLTRLSVTVEPFDAVQSAVALAAWRRFGKGRHPAGLNLGDCYSYALAKSRGAPLLFKGDDFSQTDVQVIPG